MRILHTMIRVGDLERSIAFYTEVLGMHLQTIGTVPRRYTLQGKGLKEGDAVEYLVQFDVGAAENAGRILWIDDVHLAESAE